MRTAEQINRDTAREAFSAKHGYNTNKCLMATYADAIHEVSCGLTKLGIDSKIAVFEDRVIFKNRNSDIIGMVLENADDYGVEWSGTWIK